MMGGASTTGGARPAVVDAGMGVLLGVKVRLARRRAGQASSIGRAVILGFVGLAFWALLYGVIHRLLDYFRSTPGIGDLLAAKLLGLLLLVFLSILLLSNVITALSSFYLARDLELLMAAPVDTVKLYGARLIETLAHSSWMVVLLLVPVLIAYGWVYDGGWEYVAVALAAAAALLVLPAVLGSMITLILVNVFPARRARDLLALLGLFVVTAAVVLLRLLKPERLTSPEGFRNLAEFVASLNTPQSVWLPSEWAARAIMSTLDAPGVSGDLFPLFLLATTAGAMLAGGAWMHARLYVPGFSRAQEGAELREGGSRRWRILDRALRKLPDHVRVIMAKDVRTFFRDTTQWSQLLLLAVLVAVYTYNVKVLPLRTGEEVGFFLVNVVSFLNLGLTGFVLAAIAARFIFSAVSLEGRTLWMLRSSPLRLRTLVWCKYWVGVVPLLVVALALTVATNVILQVGPFMMALSLATVVVLTLAMAAMALAYGAVFPRFDTENAAQIPTGFGGLLFMMTAIGFLAVVIMLEAWPVYAVLRARALDMPLDGGAIGRVVAGIAGAFGLAGLGTVVPLRVAMRRVEAL